MRSNFRVQQQGRIATGQVKYAKQKELKVKGTVEIPERRGMLQRFCCTEAESKGRMKYVWRAEMSESSELGPVVGCECGLFHLNVLTGMMQFAVGRDGK